MFSSGFDGVSIQTMRVRSSRCAREVRELLRRDVLEDVALRLVDLRRHAVDAAVDVRDQHVRSPGLSRCMSVVVAPSPDENATPYSAPSSDARHDWSAVRVGLPVRE